VSAATVANPPVYLPVTLAQYAARSNRAAEARELAQRALAREPYPPPLGICTALSVAPTPVECYELLQRLCEWT
jgi:predicted Zn-dependent protease